jgi:hypothetical protein
MIAALLIYADAYQNDQTRAGLGSVGSPKEIENRPNTTLEWVVEGNTARVIPLPSDPVSAFRGSGKKGLIKRLLSDRQRENGS